MTLYLCVCQIVLTFYGLTKFIANSVQDWFQSYRIRREISTTKCVSKRQDTILKFPKQIQNQFPSIYCMHTLMSYIPTMPTLFQHTPAAYLSHILIRTPNLLNIRYNFGRHTSSSVKPHRNCSHYHIPKLLEDFDLQWFGKEISNHFVGRTPYNR